MKKKLGAAAIMTMMAGLLIGTGCNNDCSPKHDGQDECLSTLSALGDAIRQQAKTTEAVPAPEQKVEAAAPVAPVEPPKPVEPQPAPPPPVEIKKCTPAEELNGKWVAVRVSNVSRIVFIDKEPNIDFRDASRISGNSGVNTIGGQYTAPENGKIKFDNMISTMKAGPQAEMDFERNFNNALGKTVSYKITEGKLFLYDSNGVELMVLQKQ